MKDKVKASLVVLKGDKLGRKIGLRVYLDNQPQSLLEINFIKYSGVIHIINEINKVITGELSYCTFSTFRLELMIYKEQVEVEDFIFDNQDFLMDTSDLLDLFNKRKEVMELFTPESLKEKVFKSFKEIQKSPKKYLLDRKGACFYNYSANDSLDVLFILRRSEFKLKDETFMQSLRESFL